MRLSDKVYDIIKFIQRWLPLVSTLYVALSAIWGWPYADEISKTLMAVAAFLAGVLEIATATYNKDIADGAFFERNDAPNEDKVNHEKTEEE